MTIRYSSVNQMTNKKKEKSKYTAQTVENERSSIRYNHNHENCVYVFVYEHFCSRHSTNVKMYAQLSA